MVSGFVGGVAVGYRAGVGVAVEKSVGVAEDVSASVAGVGVVGCDREGLVGARLVVAGAVFSVGL